MYISIMSQTHRSLTQHTMSMAREHSKCTNTSFEENKELTRLLTAFPTAALILDL